MSKSRPGEDTAPDRAPLHPDILQPIGKALKAHYDDLLQAPLPERFLDLLGRLERGEAREQGEDGPDACC